VISSSTRINIYLIIMLTICNKKTMGAILMVDIATSSSSSLPKKIAYLCLAPGKQGKKQSGAAET
jgi:hypothetical protein